MKRIFCVVAIIICSMFSGCMMNPDGSVNAGATMAAWNTAANVANATANVANSITYSHQVYNPPRTVTTTTTTTRRR
jgi:acyl-coenzyme A thioesterase PaaI-like protein